MKFLKNGASTKGFSVKRELHRALAVDDPARSIKNIHASELTKSGRDEFCPRRYALMDLTGAKPKDAFIPTSLRVTFDHGKDIESRVVNEYLNHLVFGDWKCFSCGAVKLNSKVPKGSCGLSSTRCTWRYQEKRAVSPISGASCSVDMLVGHTSLDRLRLVELKTMVKDDFVNLHAPLAEHRQRTSMYLRIIDEDQSDWTSLIDTSTAIILYVVKGYGVKDDSVKDYDFHDWGYSPFKEFIIKRDDDITDALLDKSKQVYDFRNGGAMPDRICPNSFAKRAGNCEVSKECFSPEYS